MCHCTAELIKRAFRSTYLLSCFFVTMSVSTAVESCRRFPIVESTPTSYEFRQISGGEVNEKYLIYLLHKFCVIIRIPTNEYNHIFAVDITLPKVRIYAKIKIFLHLSALIITRIKVTIPTHFLFFTKLRLLRGPRKKTQELFLSLPRIESGT